MNVDPARIAKKLRDVADRLEDTGPLFLSGRWATGFPGGSTVNVSGGDVSRPTEQAAIVNTARFEQERRHAEEIMNRLFVDATELSAVLYRAIPVAWERCAHCDRRIGGAGMPRAIRWNGLPMCEAGYKQHKRNEAKDSAA